MSLSTMYQLENLVIGLLEALNDNNSDVQNSVIESLSTLGKKKAGYVLEETFKFMQNINIKLSETHRSLIFNAMEKVVKENQDGLLHKLAAEWIELVSNQMTANKENTPIYLQEAASRLLVAIGQKYVNEVFGQLQKFLNPGKLPHLYILKTMGDLAETNSFGVVPNLSGVLASMLPMIGMAKTDIYKCAFGSAMCKFAEAIIYYCSNIEQAADQNISRDKFATEIYATHEIFFNLWLKSSEPKVKQLAIESIGHFVSLITHEKLEADLVKIITALIGLYKKHSDYYIISQSLYMTIKAGIAAEPAILTLDSIVDTVIKELFSQVVHGIEQQQNPKGLSAVAVNALNKNQIEILRCFAELAVRYSDKIVPFLIQKYELNNERVRIASLTILKHLINSCKAQMENKQQLVLSGMRQLINENNNKVKKYIIQVIVAMGYHGYLNLEGGQLLIEFLLKQCALAEDTIDDKKKPSIHDISNNELKSTAENILTLFSTTIENMHEILWPHLFEYLIDSKYSHCMNHLCKNLAHIADVKRSQDADDYIINYDNHINVPKPNEIFARLIILCGVPLKNKNQGLSVLSLMKNISSNLSLSLVELWDNVIPKLIINFEDKIANSKFNQKTWEDLIMKLLSNSLDQINDEEFVCDIAKSMGRHIEALYPSLVDEKHFAYKCVGLVLNKTSSKTTIDKQLDVIYQSVDHTNQKEREGCAISFGYCASVHLDTVLLKLETFAKNETKKSFGGIFSSILKDAKNVDSDFSKATLVLSYGYVTFYAAKDLIISRLETYILRNVGGYAAGNIKELALKQNILKSIDLITKCMHEDHLHKDFNFSYKTTLLNQIITYISADNSKTLKNDTKAMCFKILGNIIKLNPKLTEADMLLLIKTSTDSFYSLKLPSEEKKDSKLDKSIMSTSQSSSSLNQSKTEESDIEMADPLALFTTDLNVLHGNSIYELTGKALDTMLHTCLDRDMTSANLNFIFKYLEPWITSVNDHERLRAMRSLSRLLNHFADNYKLPENDESSFEYFGLILGAIVARTTDPVISIRIITIDCVENLLKLYQIFTDNVVFDQSDKLFEHLTVFKQKLVKNDTNILLGVVSDLSKVLCKLIPAGSQLTEFIEKLINGLLDTQTLCSSSSCIFLNYCVKLRAAELADNVQSLMTHLYNKLSSIQNAQAKTGTLRTIRIIFQQHLVEALNVFLTFPIPCDNHEEYFSNKSIRIHEEIVENKRFVWLDYNFYHTMEMVGICQTLCEDSKLIQSIIDHLLQIWNRCLPYEEKNGTRYATLTPLIGTCILSEIFSNNTTADTEKVFKENFEKIFCALFLRVSSTLSNVMPYPKGKDDWVDVKAADKEIKASVYQEYKKLVPSKLSVDCFKNFVKSTQSYDLYEYYESENVWSILSEESTNAEGCFILAKGFCLHATENIAEIVSNLNLFLSAPYDCHKISVTAFYAELINHSCNLEIVEKLMNSLLSKLIDQHIPVRTLCIRGLGNISSLGKEEVQKHSTTILSAMMAGLDDKDDINDDITLESMNGLTKIIALIDESNVRPILINILLRIRPCFEKEKSTIRTSAYTLFGELARFGSGPSKDPYMEQIHSNFVSFILHLNEEDESVKKACKLVLKKSGQLIQSDQINELFQTCLLEKKHLHYGEFINDLSKQLVTEFPEKISFYIMNSVSNFKSQWTEIRSNAVLFAGYMLGHLDKESQSVLSKEHITNALIKLLKEDPSPLVRQKAAEAISLLSEF